ncbi:hypothetical protein M0R89_21705 (plasmid) [Halorussus limi]|uniref:Uncharacterized protein n=2 Tax=Halobacteriales TaxID=2235 RepID=A0A8U0I1E7_9EURY|nr:MULTISPECIES: hypothetical protein [Halobacteriales]UPV77037.1 hypothetical protein M0R89_21705 [Halorussus limi]
MIPEFVISAVLGIVVFGGLAFHDVIVDRIATVNRDYELADFEDMN